MGQAIATKVLNGRYELKDPPIGQGGMGLVYRVFDTVTNRYVALKTMEDSAGIGALELFEREWSILAKLNHPNIVDILDAGSYQDEIGQHPYFVMPLLIGSTLDHIIRDFNRHQMPVQKLVEIVVQVCRGLQAAHDQGLVHRDMKPGNIFVVEDNTVKIIDFGVAHLADARSVTGIKGTLQYMAPEQMDMRPATPLSDIFSLGVVCYEALSGRRPFSRSTESAIAVAIRTSVPPPISELNPEVNHLLARTIHKAMAKQPWHRFASAREFSDTLQKAFKNEPIERFDRERIQPRINRAQRAHEEDDHQFALDILNELESEGHVVSGISILRQKAETALQRKSVRQLLDNARFRLEEEEYPLALQKLQNALECDPDNAEALEMKARIERTLQERQLESAFRLAEQYLEQRCFPQARQAVEEVLEINASNSRARNLLARIENTRREHEIAIDQQEKLYQSALLASERGEFVSAKRFIEQLLMAFHSETGVANQERRTRFESLHARIQSELETEEQAAIAARRHMQFGEFEKALAICTQELERRPANPTFQTLKLAAEEALRNQRSSLISTFISRIEAEPDLDRKYELLRKAADQFPEESYFQQGLTLVSNRRDLIASIMQRARRCEEEGQFGEAISQWELLRSISPQAHGIDKELGSLQKRLAGQAVEQVKARRIESIRRCLSGGEYELAQETIRAAFLEFPNDATLDDLNVIAKQHIESQHESKALLAKANRCFEEGDYAAALAALTNVKALADVTSSIQIPLFSVLLEEVKRLLPNNWRAAQPFVDLALAIDNTDPVARSLATTMREFQRKASVDQLIAEVTNLKESGRAADALLHVQKAVIEYPNELRLSQLLNALNSERKTPSQILNSDRRIKSPKRPQWPFKRAKAARKQVKPARSRLDTFAEPEGRRQAESSVVAAVAVEEVNLPIPKPRTSRLLIAIIVATASICLLLAGVLVLPKKHKPAESRPAPQVVKVRFDIDVPSARLLIDGAPTVSWAVSLSPGRHQIEALSAGYQTFKEALDVSPSVPETVVSIKLQSAPAVLRVHSWLTGGQFVLDTSTAVDLRDGLAEAEIPLGTHKLVLLDGTREVFTMSVTVTAGQRVAVSGLSGSAPAFVLSSLGKSGLLYTNSRWKLNTADGIRDIPQDGFDIADVSQNIKVNDNGVEKDITEPAGSSPLVSITIVDKNDSNHDGRIVVNANVNEAKILVNDVPLKRPLLKGSQAVTITPGIYKVKIIAPGYDDSIVQTVEVKPGDTKKLDFALTPIEIKSKLVLSSLPPGTEVSLDGAHVGLAGDDGNFLSELSPGTHVITLHKAGYDTATLSRDFKPNETTTISGESQLLQLGAIKVSGPLPPGTQIGLRHEGDAQSQIISNDQPFPVRPGRYVITIQVAGQNPQQSTAVISPGKTIVVTWTPSSEKQKVLSPAQLMARVLEESTSWTVGPTGWWTHQGKDFGWLRNSSNPIVIEVVKQNSRSVFGAKPKRVEFSIAYRNDGDQIAYVLDEHLLRRRILSNGVSKSEHKEPHGMENETLYRLIVLATPEDVKIETAGGRILDEVTRKDVELTGKFGFRGDVTLVARTGR